MCECMEFAGEITYQRVNGVISALMRDRECLSSSAPICVGSVFTKPLMPTPQWCFVVYYKTPLWRWTFKTAESNFW